MKPNLIPILFSTMMVQAILRLIAPKLVTRRTSGLKVVNKFPDTWKKNGDLYVNRKGQLVQEFVHQNHFDKYTQCVCPYGYPGDVMWVRETFVRACEWDGDGEMPPLRYYYKAENDWKNIDWFDEDKDKISDSPGWRPSIHMPYAACRIWLKNKSIRCERLHDITEEECILEGVEYRETENGRHYRDYSIEPEDNEGYHYFHTAYESFKSLWVKINGQESWDKNEWLWRVEFERTEKPEVV